MLNEIEDDPKLDQRQLMQIKENQKRLALHKKLKADVEKKKKFEYDRQKEEEQKKQTLLKQQIDRPQPQKDD